MEEGSRKSVFGLVRSELSLVRHVETVAEASSGRSTALTFRGKLRRDISANGRGIPQERLRAGLPRLSRRARALAFRAGVRCVREKIPGRGRDRRFFGKAVLR